MAGNKSSFWIGVAFGAVLFFSAIIGYLKYFHSSEANLRDRAQALTPPPVPPLKPFDLYDLSFVSVPDSVSVNLRLVKDKVIFLNFWATWCGPCVAEFPNIEKLAKTFKGKNVAFYIVSDEPVNKIGAFAAKKKFDLPFYGGYATLPPIYNGSSIPRTYIISKGKLILSHSGAANWNDASIIKLINVELASEK